MRFLLVIFLFLSLCFRAQVNQVNNPSFEDKFNCNIGSAEIFKAKYWNSVDSSNLICGGFYYNSCSVNPNVTSSPSNLYSYQLPKSGEAYAMTMGFYCISPSCTYPNFRGYIKNRLVSTLIPGKVYCAKLNVNLVNTCRFAIDAIQMYFGDNTIDTIKTCGIPLTYLTPQVKNTIGNIISDTLNWIEVSGTFTATGNEKYLVIGNFNSDITTSTSLFNPIYTLWSGYNIDDVSVIDFNLSASAGPDKNIFLGDSAFIGRPPEIGLECTWSSGTVSVGSSGGLWVKPTSPGTYSYVVTQNICGNIKTDTVNVNVSPSSINENTLFSNSIALYPQPAKDIVNISLNYFYEKSIEVRVVDVNGREVGEGALVVRSGLAQMQISDISDGVYVLELRNSSGQVARKRLVIAR